MGFFQINLSSNIVVHLTIFFVVNSIFEFGLGILFSYFIIRIMILHNIAKLKAFPMEDVKTRAQS